MDPPAACCRWRWSVPAGAPGLAVGGVQTFGSLGLSAAAAASQRTEEHRRAEAGVCSPGGCLGSTRMACGRLHPVVTSLSL